MTSFDYVTFSHSFSDILFFCPIDANNETSPMRHSR